MNQELNTIKPTFIPSEQDVSTLLDWFSLYESYVLKNDLDSMAAMAIFPLVVITDDSNGDCVSQIWDSDTFKQAMDMTAQGIDLSTVSIENHRVPTFLNENLAIVVTDAITTVAGHAQQARYADMMVKVDGNWRYKSMVQSSWGDMLKEHLGAQVSA